MLIDRGHTIYVCTIFQNINDKVILSNILIWTIYQNLSPQYIREKKKNNKQIKQTKISDVDLFLISPVISFDHIVQTDEKKKRTNYFFFHSMM